MYAYVRSRNGSWSIATHPMGIAIVRCAPPPFRRRRDGNCERRAMSRRTQRIQESFEAFICLKCGRTVPPHAPGTKNRNHCPYCLASRHVDLSPGDRRCSCRAVMEAVAVWVRPDGEWSIVHRCTRCGVFRANRIAGDDAESALLALAVRPMTRLPFPVETAVSGRE